MLAGTLTDQTVVSALFPEDIVIWLLLSVANTSFGLAQVFVLGCLAAVSCDDQGEKIAECFLTIRSNEFSFAVLGSRHYNF